jgi:hypothetical protein
MAVSLDVEVVLLDIGRFVPPLYLGSLSFKMKVVVKGASFPSSGHVYHNRADTACRGDGMPYKLCQRCSCEQSFFTLYLLLPGRELHSAGYVLPLHNRPARLGSPRSRSNAKDSSMHYLQMPLATAIQLQPILKHEKSLVYDGSPGAAQVLRSRRSIF